jgi:hypothetical protein
MEEINANNSNITNTLQDIADKNPDTLSYLKEKKNINK